tara:strand:- start:4997 stop:6559 length:1563 start_codon:yes stop_codon:yes gene_type:complete
MKKWLLILLNLPFVAYSQQINLEIFPYKSSIIDYFQTKKSYNYSFDSLNTGYSTLQYHSFSSKGQFIKVNHQQFFSDFILFNINFDKFSHEGIFNRENLKLHNLNTNLLFNNKSNSFSVQLSLCYQKVHMDENGGISNYTNYNFNDPLLYQVNLLSASNYLKNRNHNLIKKFKLTNELSFINEFSFTSKRRNYIDELPNSGFYQNIYLDSIQTLDSISNILLTNSFGVKYDNFTLNQLIHHRKSHINNIDSLDYDYGFSLNYDKNNIEFKTEIYRSKHFELTFLKKIQLKSTNHILKLDYQRFRVPILINSYLSNNYHFNNNFFLTKATNATYTIKYKNHLFISKLMFHSDYIYIDENSHYQQFNNDIINWTNKWEMEFNWRKINYKHTLEYNFTDNTNIIRFPKLNYSSSFWLESNLFGDNLNTRFGVDLNYFSSYYAMAYNPALAKYYLQNSQMIGDIPLVSPYLSLKVNEMLISMKYRNIISLFNSNSNEYYLVPNYPYYPRIFQLSLIWRLNNFSS